MLKRTAGWRKLLRKFSGLVHFQYPLCLVPSLGISPTDYRKMNRSGALFWYSSGIADGASMPMGPAWDSMRKGHEGVAGPCPWQWSLFSVAEL